MIDITKYKPLFPLKTIDDVEKLFKCNIDPENGAPNLALLSIVIGLVEHSLVTINDKQDLAENSTQINFSKDRQRQKISTSCCLKSFKQHVTTIASSTNEINKTHHKTHQRKGDNTLDSNEARHVSFEDAEQSHSSIFIVDITIPEVEFEVVETLYRRFVEQIKNSFDPKDPAYNRTNLKIKKISDIIWFNLSNSYYKDKAHLQTIFSYLTTSKLDCFGLAFAVVSGCQILNMKDIYLALSEDHAWVMIDSPEDQIDSQKLKEVNEYIENGQPVPVCASHETCEVTWHGKANSDKRGLPVTYKNSWLYTNGYAVKCDTKLCVAALVSSINPSINSNTDSEVLALLQQRLLWILLNNGSYFLMSLGNLGELEDISPTNGTTLTPIELFHLGIGLSRTKYNDSHVYPYTYLASFFFRHGRFKEAIETWASASAVMTKYNYSRDDEEIYKEFFEVANDLLPSMLKVLTAGGLEPGQVSKKPFLQDPDCLALILRIYDNICLWEEGSSTPVLHIGWAKSFVATVLKFSSIVRSRIKLWTEDEWMEQKPSSIDDSTHIAKRFKGIKRSATDPICSASDLKKLIINDNNIKNLNDIDLEEIKKDTHYIADAGGNVHLILWSQKLTGARVLLQADRLNTSAIQLQLTAQSQCVVKGRSSLSTSTTSTTTRSKRFERNLL